MKLLRGTSVKQGLSSIGLAAMLGALNGCSMGWDYSSYFSRLADEATIDFGQFDEEYAQLNPMPRLTQEQALARKPGDPLPTLPGYVAVAEHDASATPFLSKISTKVWARNTGEKAATDLKWSFDGEVGTQNFEVKDSCDGVIEPYRLGGKPCAIEVTFYPNTALGEIPSRIKLSFVSDGKPREASLPLKGLSQAIPFLYVEASPAFPPVYVPGMSASTQRFQIRFNGSRLPDRFRAEFPPAVNVAFRVSGSDSARFSIVGSETSCGATVSGDCVVALRFTPDARANSAPIEYRSNLQWTFDTSAGGSAGSYGMLALGTPVVPSTLVGAPTSGAFGDIQRNPRDSLAPVRDFVITRDGGNQGGVITAVALSGAQASSFRIVSSDCVERSFSGTDGVLCSVRVRFKPGLEASLPSTKAAQLRVDYQSLPAAPSSLVIALSGRAVQPGVLEVVYPPTAPGGEFGSSCAFKAQPARTLQVRNAGAGFVYGVVPGVGASVHFSRRHDCVATPVASGAVACANVSLAFQPQAAGALSGDWAFAYDDGTEDGSARSLTVTAHGTGLPGPDGCLDLVRVGVPSPAVVNVSAVNRFMIGGVAHVYPVVYKLYGTTQLSGGITFGPGRLQKLRPVLPADQGSFQVVPGTSCPGLNSQEECTVRLRYVSPVLAGDGIEMSLLGKPDQAGEGQFIVSGILHSAPSLSLTPPASVRSNTDNNQNLVFSLRNTSPYFSLVPQSGGVLAVKGPAGCTVLSPPVATACASGIVASLRGGSGVCAISIPFNPLASNGVQSCRLDVSGLIDEFSLSAQSVGSAFNAESSTKVTLTALPASVNFGTIYFEANEASTTSIPSVPGLAPANRFTVQYRYGRDATSVSALTASVATLSASFATTCASPYSLTGVTPAGMCSVNFGWRPTAAVAMGAIGNVMLDYTNGFVPVSGSNGRLTVPVLGAYVKKIPAITLTHATPSAGILLGSSYAIRVTATNGTGVAVGKANALVGSIASPVGAAWAVNLNPTADLGGARVCGAVTASAPLEPGSSCVFDVGVIPQVKGAVTATLQLVAKNSGGEGIPAVSRALSATGALPALALSSALPASIAQGASVSRTVRVSVAGLLGSPNGLSYSVVNSTGAALSQATVGAGCAASPASSFPCDVAVALRSLAVESISGYFRVKWGTAPAAPYTDLPISSSFTSVTAGLSPATFGTVAPGGTSSPVTLTLRNPAAEGSSPSLTFPALTGVFRYSVGGAPGGSGRCLSSQVLAAGGSCTLAIEYRPTDPGEASFMYNIGRSGLADLSVSLSGSGSFPGVAIGGGSLALGNVSVGAGVSRTLSLLSASDVGDLVVSAPSVGYSYSETATGCASWASASRTARLAPGVACVLTLNFSPATAAASNYTFTMTIAGRTGGSQVFTATGVLPVIAAGANFGGVAVGGTHSISLSVSNAGVGEASGLTYELNAAVSAGFSLGGLDCASISAAGGCSLSLQFAPSAAGARSAQIRVVRGAIAGPWVTVLGAGVAPTLGAVDFGKVRVDESTTRPWSVTNSAANGSVPAGFRFPALSAPFSFVGSDTCAAAMTPSGGCSVQVRFAPTAVGAAGVAPVVGTGVQDIRVFAGPANTCIIDDVARVKCWGSNVYGQLATGSTTAVTGTIASRDPIDLSGHFSLVRKLVVSERHLCALGDDGAVLGKVTCWGSNEENRLGMPVGASRLSVGTDAYVQAGASDLSGVLDLSAGYSHTCAVTASQLHCWGNNAFGKLGRGDAAAAANVVSSALPAGKTGFGVYAGRSHTCVGFSDGRARCFGANGVGQSAASITSGEVYSVTSVYWPSVAADIAFGSGYSVAGMALGAESSHTCSISGSGLVKCFGQASESPFPTTATSFAGLLGHCWNRTSAAASALDCSVSGLASGGRFAQAYGNSSELAALPSVDLGAGFGAAQIAAGGSHTCVRSTAGAVKCWGKNDLGQLGNGGSAPAGQTSASMGAGLSTAIASGVTDLAVGLSHACAVVNGTELRCWGDGGMIGLGTADAVRTPVSAYDGR